MTQGVPKSDDVSLEHFPVTFFATVMGLAGMTLALHVVEARFGWGSSSSTLSLWVTIVDFIVLAAVYLLKALRYPQAVVAEWHHPVKMAFFPAISISLLLIATALREQRPELALGVWCVGAIAQGGLTLAVISGWIGRRPFQPMHISPAWFIPAVGNVIVPVAGVPFGFVELSWLFFSTGVLFWIVLLTLVMNRLIFHDPLPGRLLPTLGVLIAPPAVAFLAWLQLNGGEIDAFARILYNASLVFAAIVALQAPGFAKLPFALSWWALSFPVAGLTLATMHFGRLTGSSTHDALGLGFWAVLLLIMAGLIVRTILAKVRGELCRPE
jgi:tellurite resistance protein